MAPEGISSDVVISTPLSLRLVRLARGLIVQRSRRAPQRGSPQTAQRTVTDS